MGLLREEFSLKIFFFFLLKESFKKEVQGKKVSPLTILLRLPNPISSSPVQTEQKVRAVATLMTLKNDISENDFCQSFSTYQWRIHVTIK